MGRLLIIIAFSFALSGCEPLDRVHAALDVLVGVEPQPGEQPQQPQQPPPQQQYASGFYQPGQPPVANGQPPNNQPHAQQQPVQYVELFDKGLNMVSGTVPVPAGWTVHQDLELNTETLAMNRFVLDYIGPQGQLIRAVQLQMYGPILPHRSFEKTWRNSVERALGNVENLTLSAPQPSERFAQTPAIHHAKTISSGETLALEVTLTGNIQGQAIEGTAFLMHLKHPQQMGGVSVMVAVAPVGLGAATAQTFLTMAHNQKQNPAYEARIKQLSEAASKRSAAYHQSQMRQSQAAHQARMQQNQANFDAHQARMRGQSAAFDRTNQAWLDNFRGSAGGGGGGGTGYDSQAQLIDTIYERNSFAAPEGNVVHNDVYQYNYTDGHGNFFGTDDPNFNPASLQGNWTATNPLQP